MEDLDLEMDPVQVMSSIPSESQGESFDMALSRVRRCIGGGGGGALGDDSDSDLEVVSEWVTVNLRCPVRLINTYLMLPFHASTSAEDLL